MSGYAIQVRDLAKHYRLGAGPMGRGDFRDAVSSALRSLLGRGGAAEPAAGSRDLWALEGVSFDVRKSEVVGVIGPNGAGKSTLLKILSRITDPTSGEAWLEGRLGSLLEVGTGFHPELSGRENIFLSGALLGMKQREIASRFDEIVEFSQIGRFLDTPVKRYSSGMYVRLGFAVAAHLEPEILIVDEVLAVGDAAFQRRCMDKMKQAAREGRTILFVSHNMASVQALCDRALVLNGGRIVFDSHPVEAVKAYLKSVTAQSDRPAGDRTDRRGRGAARTVNATITGGAQAEAPGVVLYGEDVRVQIEVSAALPGLSCTFGIYDHLGRRACRFSSRNLCPADRHVHGSRAFTCEIPALALVPGDYSINVALASEHGLEDHLNGAATFKVEDGRLDGRVITGEQKGGVFAPRHRWTLPVR